MTENFTSPNGYFRIDIQGGKTSDYSLQIQYCLGKGQTLQGLNEAGKQHNGELVSSIFAIVSWSKDTPDIDANLFANMLEFSLAEMREIDLAFIMSNQRKALKNHLNLQKKKRGQ